MTNAECRMQNAGCRPLHWHSAFCILHSAFLVVGLFLLTAVPAPAQEPGKKPPSAAFLEGTEAFRRIIYDAGKDLSKDGFTPLKTFNDLDDPKHTLLIVFGDAGRLTEVPHGVESFVQRGGALFLATDRRLPWGVDVAVGRMTSYVVSGSEFVADDPASCYRGLDDCPFLTPQQGAQPDLFRNLVSEGGLSTVATNIPSYLEATDNRLGPPALSPLAWVDNVPFGVGADVGDEGGRVLLLADHSIFINEMLMQQDNGNVEFSYNCLKWMVEGPNGPRTQVLFVEDGKINSKFDVALKDVPDDLADRLMDFLLKHLGEAARKATPAMERDLQAFDERNGFNRLLLRWCREHGVPPYEVLQVLLVVAAMLVVLYGCWKIGWKARYRSDLQGPLLATALHRVAPAGTVAEQRGQALIGGANLWEPARDLARQCLAETGARAGAAPPPIAVRGGWLRRWTMTGRLRRLWRLAYGPPVRVRRGEWRRLLREVQELKGAFADGTLQWQ